jgi:hypothetical protein
MDREAAVSKIRIVKACRAFERVNLCLLRQLTSAEQSEKTRIHGWRRRK